MKLLIQQQLPHKLSTFKKQLIRQQKYLEQRQVSYNNEIQQQNLHHRLSSQFINFNQHILPCQQFYPNTAVTRSNKFVSHLTKNQNHNNIQIPYDHQMNKSIAAALLITIRVVSLINYEMKRLWRRRKIIKQQQKTIIAAATNTTTDHTIIETNTRNKDASGGSFGCLRGILTQQKEHFYHSAILRRQLNLKC